MLRQKIETPKILRGRLDFSAVRIDLLGQTCLKAQEHTLDKWLFASLVNCLDFSEQTNQIFEKVRLNKGWELRSELLMILYVTKFQYFCYFWPEFVLNFNVGISSWHPVQVLELLEIFNVLWEFLDEELKGRFRLSTFIQFDATLSQQLMINHFILDLWLIFLQFLIHRLPPLRIPERNHSIEVVMGKLGRFQFCCLDEVIKWLKRLEKRSKITSLHKNPCTRWWARV